jgi:hypothetical protein
MSAYAILVAMLLLHLPHAEQTALQVAAPQHEAAKVASLRTCQWNCAGLSRFLIPTVPTLGTARSGKDNSAPILGCVVVVVEMSVEIQDPPCSDVSTAWQCCVHVQVQLVAGRCDFRPK